MSPLLKSVGSPQVVKRAIYVVSLIAGQLTHLAAIEVGLDSAHGFINHS
jgi:hypothetical protein